MLEPASLKDQHIAVVIHTYNTPTGGLAQELVEYLNERAARVFFIYHPFPSARMPLNSVMRVFDGGKLVDEVKTPAPRGPSVLFYLLDIFFTLYFLLRARERVDLFIGLDNLNAFTGLLLKKLGRVKSVVFYVIDYVPQRFESRWLNDVYHWIDKLCCQKADAIWNVSPAMMQARRARWSSVDGFAPDMTVPLGCPFDRIERLSIKDVNRHHVVFMGSLTYEQGIGLLLEAWSAIRARVADANLVIIGGGELEAALRAQTKQLRIESSVRFLGFIPDDVEMEQILSRCAVGVAPYREDKASFKYYADPGKVKLYMAAGLPVVITRVPPIAREIEQANAGITIRYDCAELAQAVVALLSQDDLYVRQRENAIKFAERYSWQLIFDDAFAQTTAIRPDRPSTETR
jgi:glycosyltransferase involved in cell wall biosynthesis